MPLLRGKEEAQRWAQSQQLAQGHPSHPWSGSLWAPAVGETYRSPRAHTACPPDPRNLVSPLHSTPSFPTPALVFSSTKFSTRLCWPSVDGRGVRPRAGLAQHRGTHGHLGGETGWEERDGEGKTKSLPGAEAGLKSGLFTEDERERDPHGRWTGRAREALVVAS